MYRLDVQIEGERLEIYTESSGICSDMPVPQSDSYQCNGVVNTYSEFGFLWLI
jgi:hypothetical protein